MLSMNVETFLACDAEPNEAKIVLFGAPFDSTTSFRPGTRFGSGAIRRESYGLESYSPYQDKDLTDYSMADTGDLELCIGDTNACAGSNRRAHPGDSGRRRTALYAGRRTSGNTGCLPCHCKEISRCTHRAFDAHADLRRDYLGVETFSRIALSVAAGISSATARSSSSASARATARSSAGALTMSTPIVSILTAWSRHWRH